VVRVRRPLLIGTAAALVIAGGVAVYLLGRPVAADAGTTVVRTVRDPLPLLEGETLQGEPIATTDFLGSVLVMNVWATWCGPCELEQPELVRVANAYAGEGVEFLGIDTLEQAPQAQEWERRYDVPYPSLHDPYGRAAVELEYVGPPATYIVDEEGMIRVAITGPTTEAQLSGLLEEVLAGDSTMSPSP
jgi:thiol-disulfide isomerase/thioredoxin